MFLVKSYERGGACTLLKKKKGTTLIVAIVCKTCGAVMEYAGFGTDGYDSARQKYKFVCTKDQTHPSRILSLASLQRRGVEIRIVEVPIRACSCNSSELPDKCPECGEPCGVSHEDIDRLTAAQCSRCGVHFGIDRSGGQIKLVPIE